MLAYFFRFFSAHGTGPKNPENHGKSQFWCQTPPPRRRRGASEAPAGEAGAVVDEAGRERAPVATPAPLVISSIMLLRSAKRSCTINTRVIKRQRASAKRS